MKFLMVCMIFGCLAVGATAGDILNGLAPSGKPQTLALKQELRIGSQQNPDFAWSGSKTTLVANQAGMMYLMDPSNHRLLQFDPAGKLVRTVGSEGQGPGEFQFMTNFCLRKDGTLVVFEFRRGVHVYTSYDANLKLIEQKKLTAFDGKLHQSVGYGMGADLYTAFSLDLKDAKSMNVGVGVWSADHKELLPVYSNTLFPFDSVGATDPNWWSGYLAQWFAMGPRQAVVVHDEQGRVYVALSNKYEITRYDAQLKKSLTFGRKYKPKALSEDHLKKMLEPVKEDVLETLPGSLHQYVTSAAIAKGMANAGFPEVKQPIFGLVPMGDHLLVLHDYKVDSNQLSADIFDNGGKFVGSVDLPNLSYTYYGAYFGSYLKLFFIKDKAYGLLKNEDGELSIARFSHKLVPAK